jgi:hypothetical protein
LVYDAVSRLPPAVKKRVKLLPLPSWAGWDSQELRANGKNCAQLCKEKTGQQIGRLDKK